MKTCYFCKGPIQKKPVDYMARRKGQYTLIKNLVTEVCAQCGEIYLDPQVSQKIDDALSQSSITKEHINVSVINNF